VEYSITNVLNFFLERLLHLVLSPNRGAMGVSFKIEKRKNRCPVMSLRSWLRRAEGGRSVRGLPARLTAGEPAFGGAVGDQGALDFASLEATSFASSLKGCFLARSSRRVSAGLQAPSGALGFVFRRDPHDPSDVRLGRRVRGSTEIHIWRM
jgi:hypothetical protein